MRKLITICALTALCSAAFARDEQKVYSWEDEDGNVYYGDSIPAEYAERPKRVLNEQGVSVQEIEGKKTEEQLEQERKEQQVRVAQELQRRADLALLNTYLSVEELVMHRDRRVELFQAQARVTELYLNNLQRRLDKIRDEASKYQPYSEDPNAPMIPDDLADDLRETKETIERHERNLQKYEHDEKQIFDRFDGDIERFKILKGISNPSMTAASSGS
jgi:hypothetical protein